MAKVCDVCGKGPQTGNWRSHSMNASKRRFMPNLQKMRAEIKGKVLNIRICTSCLKANKVKKVI